MKRSLFRNIPRYEGDSFDTSCILAFGKCTKQSYTIKRLPDGTALDNDNAPDGYYLVINIPFYKRKKYIDPDTFENTEGICYPRILVRVRRVGNSKKTSLLRLFTWAPIESRSLTQLGDAYDHAVDIQNRIK